MSQKKKRQKKNNSRNYQEKRDICVKTYSSLFYNINIETMIHHVKITFSTKKQPKRKKPFRLVLSIKATKKYNEPRYNILVTKEENEKIWKFIEALKSQRKNKHVKFCRTPSSWDTREYAFYALVRGTKTEIEGIFDIISKEYYPKSRIEFEY